MDILTFFPSLTKLILCSRDVFLLVNRLEINSSRICCLERGPLVSHQANVALDHTDMCVLHTDCSADFGNGHVSIRAERDGNDASVISTDRLLNVVPPFNSRWSLHALHQQIHTFLL